MIVQCDECKRFYNRRTETSVACPWCGSTRSSKLPMGGHDERTSDGPDDQRIRLEREDVR